MKIVSILCLLFVVAKADISKEDLRVRREIGRAIKSLEDNFLDSINPGHKGEPISGRFVYTGDDGQQYDVFYFANMYGYQAQGRLVQSNHPLAHFLKKWNTRITLKGKYGKVVDDDNDNDNDDDDDDDDDDNDDNE